MWYMYSLSVITAVRRSGRTRGIAAAGSLPLPPPRPALHATAATPAVLTPSWRHTLTCSMRHPCMLAIGTWLLAVKRCVDAHTYGTASSCALVQASCGGRLVGRSVGRSACDCNQFSTAASPRLRFSLPRSMIKLQACVWVIRHQEFCRLLLLLWCAQDHVTSVPLAGLV